MKQKLGKINLRMKKILQIKVITTLLDDFSLKSML